MQNGRIIKTELKEKAEKTQDGDLTHEMVIVTVEIPGPHGFTAKVQHLVEVEDAAEWQLGGIASVDTTLKQQEMALATR